MRTFNFKARNFGDEKYLTYTMGADCELDEDVLDYCEENEPAEVLGIIYEEDDDYDYLTYDITGRVCLEEYIADTVNCEKVLCILRNLAGGLISLKEQAIHLSYILLNRNFVYIDEADCSIKFICLPIESKGAVAAEFKGFVRQLLANMKYDVDEELGYVGKLLTYINGDSFNLRGLIGLSEALMEETGISFEETGTIEADGVEVVNAEPELETDGSGKEEKVADFMSSLSDKDEPLPEIGDDEEDEYEEESVEEEELESILPAGMNTPEADVSDNQADDGRAEPEEMKTEPDKEQKPEEENKSSDAEADSAETGLNAVVKDAPKSPDVNLIKNRIKEIVGDVPVAKTNEPENRDIKSLQELDALLESRPPVVKRNVVKVNRAALIQNIAAEQEAEAEHEAENNSADGKTENIKVPVIEDVYEEEKPKSNSVLSKTVAETSKTNNLINVPKAVPYLVRVNTDERIMLGKVTFKIGKATRGVDYTVSGNGAISRQHAVILQKDGVCYIKDNKSTNHTYVNGKMIEDGVEEILTHDSMIKLGDEEFRFKIR